MTTILRKYKLEELKIGMQVFIEQLSEIYDTWIVLTRPKDSALDKKEGYVAFIGKETNEESDKLFLTGDTIIPVYHDSAELDGDMYYEE